MQLEGREPWEGAGVCSSSLKGQHTAKPGRPRITQRSPGQGGVVPLAVLGEVWVPNSLRDAEDSGKAQRSPAGEHGGREEQGGSGRLLQHLPFAQRSGRAAGGERVSARAQREPGSHFLPADTHWPGTSPCSRNADRVAAARIIGRLPRRGCVHVSLRCRSGYGTSTKPQPCIIQPLCYRRCRGEELSPAPAGASRAQAAPAAGLML